MIKYGVINDRDFFDWLLENGERILAGAPDARKEAVVRSCQSKAAVVAEDEKEAGVRALLNLNCAFGHAIEAQVGFDDVLKHGEAVAIGMVMALEMSSRLAVAPQSARDELVEHLEKIGLPTSLKRVGWRQLDILCPAGAYGTRQKNRRQQTDIHSRAWNWSVVRRQRCGCGCRRGHLGYLHRRGESRLRLGTTAHNYEDHQTS